jgi:putative ABC transport system permease protein
VTPIGTFPVAYLGQRLDGAAVSGVDLLADGRLSFRSGNREVALRRLDEGGAAIIPASQADRLGLVVGDVMQFMTGMGPIELRVVGIVDRSLPGPTGETVLIGWPDARDRFGVLGADLFAVRFEPGGAAAAEPAIAAIATELALQVSTLGDLQGAIGGALGRVFGLFDALALVTLLVAGLGIVNTLTMNVAERIREIGVLRATGMTRLQVWRMVVVEAGVLGTAGAILGCLAGLAVTLILIGPGSLPAAALSIPWATLAAAGLFGIVVAVLAAAWPARVASRISIVRAVQLE